MSADFDSSGLFEACADWPRTSIPEAPARDALMERLRQILLLLQAHPDEVGALDLPAVLRHMLLRRPIHRLGEEWLRVPAASGWPSAVQWRDASFDVIENGAWFSIRAKLPRLAYLGEQADLFDEVFQERTSRADAAVEADPAYTSLLGFSRYTGDGLREAVRALIQLPAGQTLIANLPTGSGKSVLAQLPPLLGGQGTLTLVIVPTVALAIDQAARMEDLLMRLDANSNPSPLSYHGGLGEAQRREVRQAVLEGKQRVLFLSPEHAIGSLRQVLERAARGGRLSHVVIDEAHLVIGWGTGFRPAFQLLPALIGNLRRQAPRQEVRIVLASATLTASTIRGLQQLFGGAQRAYVVSGVHLRSEPRYTFVHCHHEGEKRQKVMQALSLAPRPFILYVTRPDEAESWAGFLRRAGFSRLSLFTGDTRPDEREDLLRRWKCNELDGMVATSAFGLGVDKGDVRTIVHATLPESLDRYYQEVGRSGRDGKASASLLFFTDEDAAQAKRIAATKVARERTAFERWCLMIDQAQVDPERSDVFWLELGHLPPHLVQESEASSDWNLKSLTLMARAGMIELVDLTRARGAGAPEQTVEFDADARFAAVRLLQDDLRSEQAFRTRLAQGRADIRKAGTEGFRAMLDVARGSEEIAQALRKIYSVLSRDAWSPVAEYCGGCPRHWGERRWKQQPLPPVVPRLGQFAPRHGWKDWAARVPMASDNLMVVAVPAAAQREQLCRALVRVLVHTLAPHTLVLGPGCPGHWRRTFPHDWSAPVAQWPFIDEVRTGSMSDSVAGIDEVRIVLWGLGGQAPIPSVIWTSRAALEVLVVPAESVHPDQPLRRFIDTTPHVHAADIVEGFSQWQS